MCGDSSDLLRATERLVLDTTSHYATSSYDAARADILYCSSFPDETHGFLTQIKSTRFKVPVCKMQSNLLVGHLFDAYTLIA